MDRENSGATRLETGEVRIEVLELNTSSRADIATLLMGLQELYGDEESRAILFGKLEKQVLSRKGANRRPPTLGLWQIYVLANLWQALGRDVDYVVEIAEEMNHVRKFLGLSSFWDSLDIDRGTLKKYIDLIGQEFIVESSQLIMKSGREVRKRAREAARLRAAAKRLARAERLTMISKKSADNSDATDQSQGEFNFDP